MPIIHQKIVPHLWFDKEAIEAAEFYCSVFPNSSITSKSFIKDTPSGDTEIVVFRLVGPLFQFNESISFQVHCADQAEVDHYWEKLSADPVAEQCGWLKLWGQVTSLPNKKSVCQNPLLADAFTFHSSHINFSPP